MSLYLTRIENFPLERLLYIGYNQDDSCLAIGTTNGFRIYNCVANKETVNRKMLFRCNILALVGGGEEPAYAKNKVILWDDNQCSPIGELSFKSDVRAVKLRREKVVIVLDTNVYVYNFDKLERTHKFDTIANPRGMVSLSSQNDIVLAFPHTVQGQVVVQLLSKNTSHIISAHNGDIACMTLNRDGTLLATASDKGTLIRIWETATGKKLQEVRRGSEKATIYSIAFSHDSNFICTSSDKGTVHVFALSEVHLETDEKNEGDKPVNRKSRLGGLLGGYWGSEWSFAWYNGPEVPSIVAFSADNGSVFLGSGNEVFTKISFDPVKGGECIKKTENKFITDKK